MPRSSFEPGLRSLSVEHPAAAGELAGDRLYRSRQFRRGRAAPHQGLRLHSDSSRRSSLRIQLGVHLLAVSGGSAGRCDSSAALLFDGGRILVACDGALQPDKIICPASGVSRPRRRRRVGHDSIGLAGDSRDVRQEASRPGCRNLFRRQQDRPHARHPARLGRPGELGVGVGLLHHRIARPLLGRVVARGLSSAA